jgi:5'-3' exonuclease
MILIDYNGIAISNVVTQKLRIDENLIRHMILNSIRLHRKKFHKQYGEVVICCDGMKNWRLDVFPQYKHKRRDARKQSDIDWNEVFRITNLVRDELKENFPYKVIEVPECEADDIIAQLALQTTEFGKHEEVMIISGDKDFAQLQVHKNIKQYSPVQNKFITEKNPKLQLMELILKGDTSDGVPNVLSDDNCFVSNIRQTPLRQKVIDDIIKKVSENEGPILEPWWRNYQRNRRLIDLTMTPDAIKQKIIDTYEGQDKWPNKGKVLPYLVTKQCRLLLEEVQDFI